MYKYIYHIYRYVEKFQDNNKIKIERKKFSRNANTFEGKTLENFFR